MDDSPIKVEITLSPELYAIAYSTGNVSEFIEAATTLFISSSQFYDYLYLNKCRIAEVKKARYLQELSDVTAALDAQEKAGG